MSIVFSKNKEKRSRSSSSEANNSSFVKNVTSRVSGLLPAAVTKWFSSPSSSSNANGSTQTADVTDSSTEDEATESPIAIQPPKKRMRFTSPGSFNHYVAPEFNCISSNAEANDIDAVTVTHTLGRSYGTVQSPPGRSTFRRETNFVSTPIRLDDTDTVDKDSTLIKSKTQHTVSKAGPSVATKRKSIFDTPVGESLRVGAAKTSFNTLRDPREPCFKPSLLGSPFYSGRTVYGGASSSYINRPNIQQRKNTLINEESTSDNTVSYSTRRIMDLLENYSSPLSEARRIPQYTRTSNSLNSSLSSPSPPFNKIMSYKTQELHLPGIASLLRLKQRSRLLDTTTAARQLIASHSSTSDYVPYNSLNKTPRNETDKEASKLITKVKAKVARPKRRENNEAETELPAPVNLPSAVLQIDQNNLPKFSFNSAPAPQPSTKPHTITHENETTSKITETTLRKPDIVTSSQAPYKFSSPVRISSEAQVQPTSELPKFTFGSPDRSVDKINEKKNDDVSCVVGATKEPDNRLTATKSKDWQCPDCWVYNKTDIENCVCCGGKKPSAHSNNPAKCSVCYSADSQPNKDKCASCERIKVSNKKEDLWKWRCSDCWVDNDGGVEVCVCCGGAKPTAAPKQNAVVHETESEWKCNDCWIKNKNSVEKCAACGAAKPGAKSTTPAPATGLFNSPLPKPPDNTFKPIAKMHSDKWECPSCLVRNDGNRNRCVCCETARPGSITESDKKSFNFGINSSTTFKFGIPTSMAETSKPAEVPTATITSKKEESETNNNVLSKTPTFTFSLSVKKTADLVDSPKNTEDKKEKPKAPNLNFSFGIPKSSADSAPTTTSMFGIPSKPAEAEKSPTSNEKPQEVPKVDFTIPKPQEPPKSISSIFGTPVASTSAAADKPAVVPAPVIPEKPQPTLLFNTTISAEKKDVTSNPLTVTLQPATTTASIVPSTPASTSATSPPAAPATSTASAFTFGGIRISSNLFASPSTTEASMSFGSNMQSTSFHQNNQPSTTTSAMSLFSKSETPSTASLFAKAETPASTTAASAAAPAPAAAPLFSFGGGAQSPKPDKPQFNFTFGSTNKTETTSLFGTTQPPTENKFTFGASTENKFALPNSNALGSSNTLGGNGLSTGGALGGNGLSTNPLGTGTGTDMNNPLGGNGMQANSLQPPSGGLFGANVQKENMWPSTNNTTGGLFASNTTTNATPLQKPATFTFGASTPFNASSSTPTFGTAAQSSGNMFEMSTASGGANQPMFSSGASGGQSGGVVFGSPQPAAAPMFGSPSVGAAPTFGAPNASISTFEAPSLTPAPAPAFNFGASAQQTSGVFGFGQPQGFNFGATAAVAPQVQFNMGSAPNTAVRRVRKAIRRNTPR